MKVAVFTLLRDRLEYTKICLARLREFAGYPFDHFVLDNGSEDGTREWLDAEFAAGRIYQAIYSPMNEGISIGCNKILAVILGDGGREYDLILKFDNDCFPLTQDFLAEMVRVATLDPSSILSPWVEGITTKPSTAAPFTLGGVTLFGVMHCGGLCRLAPRAAHVGWQYPESLPKATGQDIAFSRQAWQRGFHVAYLRDVKVEHFLTTKGQERDPIMQFYFERKRREERESPHPMSDAVR